MSKELEALKIIKIKCHPNSNPSPLVDEALNIIEQALQKLDKYEDVFNGTVEKQINMYSRQAMIVGMNLRAGETKREFDVNI